MSIEQTPKSSPVNLNYDPDGFASLAHVRVRRWFCVYAIIVALSVAALFVVPQDYRPLVYCFIILTTFTTFIPGNVTYVIFIQVHRNAVPAKILHYIDKVIDTSAWGGLPILPVGLLGALASAIANLNDYHGLTLVFRSKKVRRFGNTAFYHFVKRWFDQMPFALLLLCEFFPLPVAVVRWLAVTRAYPRWRLALACFMGRLPRYLLTAYLARSLNPNWWQTLLFCVIIALIPVMIMRIKGRRTQPQPATLKDGEIQ